MSNEDKINEMILIYSLPSIRFSFCILSLFQKDNTKEIAEPITHLPLPLSFQVSPNKKLPSNLILSNA